MNPEEEDTLKEPSVEGTNGYGPAWDIEDFLL